MISAYPLCNNVHVTDSKTGMGWNLSKLLLVAVNWTERASSSLFWNHLTRAKQLCLKYSRHQKVLCHHHHLTSFCRDWINAVTIRKLGRCNLLRNPLKQALIGDYRVSYRFWKHGGALQNFKGGRGWGVESNTWEKHGLKWCWKIPVKEFIC